MTAKTDVLIVVFGCIVIGIIGVILSIATRTGRYKRWWLRKSSPIAPVSIVYVSELVSILLFFTAILVGFQISPATRGMIFLYFGCPSLILMVVLSIWQPRWLTPKWLRWLEAHYENLIPLLREDAIRMGAWKWERQVSTQEGLEEWVAEVRQKHKLDEVDQRFIGDPHA